MEKCSMELGKKEHVLNYACQLYQSSHHNKIRAIMALIRDCIDYTFNPTFNYVFDGYIREKSVVNDNLAKKFKDVTFEESDPELDHAGDIDYVVKVGKYQFGIQIKPVTANANFGGYSLSERMKASFDDFTEKYGGKVFIVYSQKEVIVNKEVVDEISKEIERLKAMTDK